MTLPAVITAPSWGAAWSALWTAARKANGDERAPDGTLAPKLRDDDALAVAVAWVDVAGASRFPLWYQFGALAYGWNPPASDALDPSPRRRAAKYPAAIANELWLVTSSLADDLDAAALAPVRLDLAGRWSAITLASVQAALRADGAQAAIARKMPTGACRDDATGKTRAPVLECVSPTTGRKVPPRYLNGLPYCPTGYDLKASCPTGTTPITYDDPLTAILKGLAGITVPIALIVAAVGLLGDRSRRPRR